MIILSLFFLTHIFLITSQPKMSVTAGSTAVGASNVGRRFAKVVSRPRKIVIVRCSLNYGVASILTKLQKDCSTPLPVLRHVADAMAADMRAGISVDGGSNLKMIPSYVDILPTG